MGGCGGDPGQETAWAAAAAALAARANTPMKGQSAVPKQHGDEKGESAHAPARGGRVGPNGCRSTGQSFVLLHYTPTLSHTPFCLSLTLVHLPRAPLVAVWHRCRLGQCICIRACRAFRFPVGSSCDPHSRRALECHHLHLIRHRVPAGPVVVRSAVPRRLPQHLYMAFVVLALLDEGCCRVARVVRDASNTAASVLCFKMRQANDGCLRSTVAARRRHLAGAVWRLVTRQLLV